jgi:type II secretory pathway component PulJ
MEFLLAIALLAPIVLLIWALVRHAQRIRHEAIDKDARTEQLEGISDALVRYVLERDRHTCQTCGSTCRVGIDFVGETPDEARKIGPEDLEARCVRCYVSRWETLKDTPATQAERDGNLSQTR